MTPLGGQKKTILLKMRVFSKYYPLSTFVILGCRSTYLTYTDENRSLNNKFLQYALIIPETILLNYIWPVSIFAMGFVICNNYITDKENKD